MRTHRNIRAIVVATILQNLVFAYAIERLFWESRSMNVQDVVFTEIIYVVLILLLEIPAGIIADRGSRRAVLITASIFSTLEFVLILFASRFALFAAAVSAGAISSVLVSGTRNALVYESLAETGDAARFPQVLGRLEAVDSATVIVALAAGGFLAEWFGMPALYWIAIFANAAAVAVHLLIAEPARGDRGVEPASHGSELRLGLRLIVTKPRLLAALVAGIAVGGSITYFDEFLTLHLRDVAMPVWSFGIVLGGAYAARAAGALAGERLEILAERSWFFPFAVLVFLAIQALFGSVATAVGLGFVVLLYFTWGALDVIAVSRLHAAAESSYRATAESVASQIEQAVALVFGVLFGIAAERGSIASAISVTAVATGVVYLGYLLASRLAGSRSRPRGCPSGPPRA